MAISGFYIPLTLASSINQDYSFKLSVIHKRELSKNEMILTVRKIIVKNNVN